MGTGSGGGKCVGLECPLCDGAVEVVKRRSFNNLKVGSLLDESMQRSDGVEW